MTDWIQTACLWIESLGIHRYGMLFVSALLIIPAIVSVNMVVFYLQKIFAGNCVRETVRSLLVNLSIILACTTVFAWTIFAYR